MKRGYSLVEVLTVLVLMVILTSAAIWAFGGANQRELFSKISQDIVRIDSAKAAWRVEHPQDAFPADEAGRFTAIQPYLKSGLKPVGTMISFQPLDVVYFINDELTISSAKYVKADSPYYGYTFDKNTSDWIP